MIEVTEPAMTSSNDYYADLRQPSQQESELIRRICCLFLKRLEVEFLFPLNYLWVCPLIHMTASRSQKAGITKQWKSGEPRWTASLPAIPGDTHKHTHTHLWSHNYYSWCDMVFLCLLFWIKKLRLLLFNTLHLKSCWSICVISSTLTFVVKQKNLKKKEWMVLILFLTLANLHFEVKTVDRPFFMGCSAYVILLTCDQCIH